jgi:hypothetical protein
VPRRAGPHTLTLCVCLFVAVAGLTETGERAYLRTCARAERSGTGQCRLQHAAVCHCKLAVANRDSSWPGRWHFGLDRTGALAGVASI